MSDESGPFYDETGAEVEPDEKSLARVSQATRTRSKAAVAMALAGATDKEIADQLRFVSPTAARRAYEAELAGAYDPTTDYEAMRRLLSARYEGLLKSLAPKALNSKIRVKDEESKTEGATKLVDNEEHITYAREYRNTLDRIGVLHGLNAPQVIKMQTPAQAEFERVTAALVAQSTAAADGEGDIFADDTQEFEEDAEGVFVAKEDGNA